VFTIQIIDIVIITIIIIVINKVFIIVISELLKMQTLSKASAF